MHVTYIMLHMLYIYIMHRINVLEIFDKLPEVLLKVFTWAEHNAEDWIMLLELNSDSHSCRNGSWNIFHNIATNERYSIISCGIYLQIYVCTIEALKYFCIFPFTDLWIAVDLHFSLQRGVDLLQGSLLRAGDLFFDDLQVLQASHHPRVTVGD